MKTAIPIVISAIALILSFVTYYLSSMKPADIRVSVGEWMELYHDQPGGALEIHVPVVFQNVGARSGVVRSLGLILRDGESKEAIFVKWMGFLKPEEKSGGTWLWESNGTPLPVLGHDEVTKMASFYGAEGISGWIPRPAEYEVYLLAWASESGTPSKKCFVKWTFSEADVAAIRQNLEKGTASGVTSSTWMIRPGYANSKRLSAAEFDGLVR